jgi:hypothetical protein
MAVSKRLRYEVLRRDAHACRYCGATAPDVKLTVDHVIPVALGGTDVPENLVTACAACNAGKTSTNPDAPIVANVADDALRWARAMEFASDVQFTDRSRVEQFAADFLNCWEGWIDHLEETYPLPTDWEDSLERFYSLGLERHVVSNAVDVSMRSRARDKFRYFCGVCWNVYHQRVEIAQAQVRYEEDRP